jgi:curved DNA-binding protein CbpA
MRYFEKKDRKMKDYYYILGIRQTATVEEVKKAYKKLSLKFHPDLNNNDDFFLERFKEIQEAYEILVNLSKRKNYDDLKNNYSTNNINNNVTNFNPYIEYFKSDKNEIEYNENVTFSWKTINADKVILKPFGTVQPIGQKTYKIKDFKNENLTFELTAENTNIERMIRSSLTLKNKTYMQLYIYFKKKIENNKNNQSKKAQEENLEKETEVTENTMNEFLLPIIIFIIVIFIVYQKLLNK